MYRDQEVNTKSLPGGLYFKILHNAVVVVRRLQHERNFLGGIAMTVHKLESR